MLARFTPTQVAFIRQERMRGVSAAELARFFKCSKETILRVLRGETYKGLGLKSAPYPSGLKSALRVDASRAPPDAVPVELDWRNAPPDAQKVELDWRNAPPDAQPVELDWKNAPPDAVKVELDWKNAPPDAQPVKLDWRNAPPDSQPVELDWRNAPPPPAHKIAGELIEVPEPDLERLARRVKEGW